MNKKFVISLIGAPASGKGYIASCLTDELKKHYGKVLVEMLLFMDMN